MLLGAEVGANSKFKAGGSTVGGQTEAVVDGIKIADEGVTIKKVEGM